MHLTCTSNVSPFTVFAKTWKIPISQPDCQQRYDIRSDHVRASGLGSSDLIFRLQTLRQYVPCIYDAPIPTKCLDIAVRGHYYDLSVHKGKVIVVINTASNCACATQINQLVALYRGMSI
jgi:hypothetical protein